MTTRQQYEELFLTYFKLNSKSFWFDNEFQKEPKYQGKLLFCCSLALEFTRCYYWKYVFSCILLNCLLVMVFRKFECFKFFSCLQIRTCHINGPHKNLFSTGQYDMQFIFTIRNSVSNTIFFLTFPIRNTLKGSFMTTLKLI